MTITMNHIETQPFPTSNSDADRVLGILHDTPSTPSRRWSPTC